MPRRRRLSRCLPSLPHAGGRADGSQVQGGKYQAFTFLDESEAVERCASESIQRIIHVETDEWPARRVEEPLQMDERTRPDPEKLGCHKLRLCGPSRFQLLKKLG